MWLWTEVKLSVKGEGSVEKKAVRHEARLERRERDGLWVITCPGPWAITGIIFCETRL